MLRLHSMRDELLRDDVWIALSARLVSEPCDPVDYYEHEMTLRSRPLGGGHPSFLVTALIKGDVLD